MSLRGLPGPIWAIDPEDFKLALNLLGRDRFVEDGPDLVIAPAGKDTPYIYRWELVRGYEANVYFHIQVASDPERPLHDHPWDNQSVILAGGYDEIVNLCPDRENVNDEFIRKVRKGDVVQRKASEAHRLLLPPDIPYTMSLFSTGPKVRDWGFWYPGGWRSYTDVTRVVDGVSVHIS